MAGAAPPGRHAAPAGLGDRPATRSRRRHGRARGCCCSTRRTTRPARCSRARSSSWSRAVCLEHDLIAVTDEVYEHLVYDGEHVPLATLPGMAERTLTISSLGQDVLGDGLEDRVGDRPGRSSSRPCARPSSSCRSRAARRSSTRARPRSRCRTSSTRPRGRPARQARPPLRGPRGRRAGAAAPGRHVLRQRARGRRRRRVLPRAARARRRRGDPDRASSTTTRRPAARSCASRSASATR